MTVTWFLVSDEDEEIIAESTEFLDVREASEHTAAETRITDNEPDHYDK